MSEQVFQVGVKGLVRNSSGQILMVHIPEWRGNPAYWDLPGGRMNPGEALLETLVRELQEEISVSYLGQPRQFFTLLTAITIPVGDVRVPLMLVIYEVELPPGAEITLDPDSAEDEYGWFDPAAAADNLEFKYTDEFCELVRALA